MTRGLIKCFAKFSTSKGSKVPHHMGRIDADGARAWIQKHKRISVPEVAATFADAQGDLWRYDDDEWLHWVDTHWARNHTLEFRTRVMFFTCNLTESLLDVGAISRAEFIRFGSQRTIWEVARRCQSMPHFLRGYQLGVVRRHDPDKHLHALFNIKI